MLVFFSEAWERQVNNKLRAGKAHHKYRRDWKSVEKKRKDARAT
jgi:hypothetical protein